MILFILTKQIVAGFSHFTVSRNILIFCQNVKKLQFVFRNRVNTFKCLCLFGYMSFVCAALLQTTEKFAATGSGCTKNIPGMLPIFVVWRAVVIDFAKTGGNQIEPPVMHVNVLRHADFYVGHKGVVKYDTCTTCDIFNECVPKIRYKLDAGGLHCVG